MLQGLAANGRYMDRRVFEADLNNMAKKAGQKLPAPIKKAIFAALGERGQEAEICTDAKGNPEADSELRDTENIPLPADVILQPGFKDQISKSENAAHKGAKLPMFFGPDKPNDALVATMKVYVEDYIDAEVRPHVGQAWVDYSKTKIGYEIPINRHFYVYKPPRDLAEIEADISGLEERIAAQLKGLVQ